MHRRRSLGFLLLLMMVFLAGSAWAVPEPRVMSEARIVESGSSDLLSRVWDWLTVLLSGGGTSGSGSESLNGLDGGGFMDPNGGNS